MHLFRQAFEHLLKTDLVFCETHDVEFHIWKICFYHIVEALKLCAKEQPDVKRNMLQLLDEGLDFYAQMLDTLDQVCTCSIDPIHRHFGKAFSLFRHSITKSSTSARPTSSTWRRSTTCWRPAPRRTN